MTLYQESGGDATSRRVEADKLLAQILPKELYLTLRELPFVEKCRDPKTYISPKMIFWLRDIRDRLDSIE